MSIEIGWFRFEGPYKSLTEIENRAGVFAVLCQEAERKFMMVDVDEGEELRFRIEQHPNASCWQENCWVDLRYVVFYTHSAPRTDRLKIVTEIRLQYTIPCRKEIQSKPFEPPDIRELE